MSTDNSQTLEEVALDFKRKLDHAMRDVFHLGLDEQLGEERVDSWVDFAVQCGVKILQGGDPEDHKTFYKDFKYTEEGPAHAERARR